MRAAADELLEEEDPISKQFAVPPSSPEATSELAASLNKLKAKWNGPEDGRNDSLFKVFMSPSLKKKPEGPEEEGSPNAVVAKAAAAHLAALEHQVPRKPLLRHLWGVGHIFSFFLRGGRSFLIGCFSLALSPPSKYTP